MACVRMKSDDALRRIPFKMQIHDSEQDKTYSSVLLVLGF